MIPRDFLSEYQRNFRFLVCRERECQERADYAERLRFARLERAQSAPMICRVGGTPNWEADDETPGPYVGSTPMRFLLQLEPELRFATVAGASPQLELSIDGKPRAANRPHYELFIGNTIYMFGTESASMGLVYALTQVD